jgi:cytochrome P450
LRDALRSAFTPRQANRYRQVMRQEIERLCDEWLPKGAFDFEEFISYYPITVLCRMIGASPQAIPDLRESLEALGLAFSMDRANLPRLQEGMGILEHFAQDLLARRRAGERPDDGEPDLLDLLLDARARGSLSEDELVNLMIFLFGGGYDTSKNVLTLMMHQLIDRPDVYERCATDLDYCRGVTNETLRFHAPGTATRKPVEDLEFRGVRFPAGTLIMFPWGMSGRDETAFENPHSFEPGRKGAAGNFAFGLGGHICLGQFIARAQIEEGLHVIARRLLHPERNGAHGWRPFPGVWGIAGLPIRFTAAT